jgi:hypothetical protein
MTIIPYSNGYVVTNGISFARTFLEWDYDSREACRLAAFAFAYQVELYYPQIRVLFSRMLEGKFELASCNSSE